MTLLGAFSLTSVANATLISTSGGQAFYDDVLNITWLADANFATTNNFGVSGIDGSGTMTWDTANDWIAALNTASHLGFNDWRLPTLTPIAGGLTFDENSSNIGTTDIGRNISLTGTAFAGSTASELAHLFYNTLGNVSDFDANGNFTLACGGDCLDNTGPFSNVQNIAYWTNLEVDPTNARIFDFFVGAQDIGVKDGDYVAWAVRDVTAVPVPAAVWLFGSALMGLVGMRKRKAT